MFQQFFQFIENESPPVILALIFKYVTIFLTPIYILLFLLYLTYKLIYALFGKNQFVEKNTRTFRKTSILKLTIILFLISLLASQLYKYVSIAYSSSYHGPDTGKPVIYLYPPKEQEISVKLKYNGRLHFTFPEINKETMSWKVIASPEGKVVDVRDSKMYSYLFWDGNTEVEPYDMTQGWVVVGRNTADFLREKLEKFGFTPNEYNEFIVYWAPLMKDNKYNLIHFATDEYEKVASLEVTPKPDTVLRVLMVYKPLMYPIKVIPQEIHPTIRKGFTLVEWGGTRLD